MASISASGIMSAARTAALALLSLAVAAPATAQSAHSVTVEIAGLRDAKGVIRLCLTGDPKDFPDCKKPTARSATVAAGGAVRATFTGVAPGTYAIAAFHDANSNAKLDTSLGIPREGFAFSNNPAMRPRAPTWAETRFQVTGDVTQRLKLKYIL